MRVVKAEQGDTIDSIAYRYYGDQSPLYLAQILDVNPDLFNPILATHQLVTLPDIIVTQAINQTLKLWD